MKKKINYQVTVKYVAILQFVDVMAENEDEAKKLAKLEIEKMEPRMSKGKRSPQIDYSSYAPYGILNMDETWNSVE